jgi:hypothetical protein
MGRSGEGRPGTAGADAGGRFLDWKIKLRANMAMRMNQPRDDPARELVTLFLHESYREGVPPDLHDEALDEKLVVWISSRLDDPHVERLLGLVLRQLGKRVAWGVVVLRDRVAWLLAEPEGN